MKSPTLPLKVEQLYTSCDVSQIPFETSEEVKEHERVIGQERALDAIHFGTRICGDGYNMFALGQSGTGKYEVVRHILEAEAENQPIPSDWCYIYNFKQPNQPKALELPAGRGIELSKVMEQLAEDLSAAIPAAFETDEYRAQIDDLEHGFTSRREQALQGLATQAEKKDVQLVHTPSGFAFAPLDKKKEVIRPDQFKKLSDTKQKQIEKIVAQLQKQLQGIIRQFPAWQKETREKVKKIDRKTAQFAVKHLIKLIKEQFHDLPAVVTYIIAAEQDIIEHVKEFRAKPETMNTLGGGPSLLATLKRYTINLIVDQSVQHSAPVIYQDLPNHSNLLGCTEYQSQMGTLFTDFSLIKGGALHRANGGYLILDARRLLIQPYSWEGLKRALRSKEIRIEALERSLGLVSTVSLEPEPIPLDIKVVLLGDRQLYYMLCQHDPEFQELFKVAADFEDSLPRNKKNCAGFARLIASEARELSLRPINKLAVARLIEHGSRLASDSEKLSIHLRSISDVLQEADYWAGANDKKMISAEHIQSAIDHKIQRLDRVRDHIYEAIERGTINIDTCGDCIGQINGLSVLSLGDFSFGQPSRITATTRLGNGKVIDIERETDMGGNIHSKGVLILSSFLAARYATTHPLSLSASLVFEQSYGRVDGDSAAVAELCVLLSALAKVPIKQHFAVTGSINQLGKVQAIGGVNQKIEGFYDVCSATGMKSQQGVLIPKANVKHLMLRHDVLEAVRQDKFQVYAVESVDQAIEILTGVEAGERDKNGDFPAHTVNGQVERRMVELAGLRKNFSRKEKHKGGEAKRNHENTE